MPRNIRSFKTHQNENKAVQHHFLANRQAKQKSADTMCCQRLEVGSGSNGGACTHCRWEYKLVQLL